MAKDFTLVDLRRQLGQLEKMGIKNGYGLLMPEGENSELSCQQVRRLIDAMTDEERSNPELITVSSISRIAASSGTRPQDVEEFLAQFHKLRGVMRKMAEMSLWQRIKLVMGIGKPPGLEGKPD